MSVQSDPRLKIRSTLIIPPFLLDIVRILFMVPIYSIVSFASFLFWVSPPPQHPILKYSTTSSADEEIPFRTNQPPYSYSETATNQQSLRPSSTSSYSTSLLTRTNSGPSFLKYVN